MAGTSPATPKGIPKSTGANERLRTLTAQSQKPRISIRGFTALLRSRLRSVRNGEQVSDARGRDLRFHPDIGKDLGDATPHEEVWLPCTKVGKAIFAAKQPVLSQLPLQTAADRPTGQPSRIGLELAEIAHGARGSIAGQSCLDPLSRSTAGSIEQNIRGHQEARAHAQTEVVSVFDRGEVIRRSAWGEKGAAGSRAAAQDTLDGARLIVKPIVAFYAKHPVAIGLEHGARIDARSEAGCREGVRPSCIGCSREHQGIQSVAT